MPPSRKGTSTGARTGARSGSPPRPPPGPPADTLGGTPDGSVDLVFIDADKERYPFYYEESVRVLRSGGLIAADNVLWYGRVLSPEDDDSRAIVRFNRTVMGDDRVDKVMLPVRDGIYLIRKR